MIKINEKISLVVGGAGFIGSHIVDSLLNRGATVHVLDDLSNGSLNNLEQWKGHANLSFYKGDVRNPDDVKAALEDVEIVFHQAAKVSVPFSVRDPVTTMDVNALGTTVLFNECRKMDIEKIVVASSSSVYGDTPTLPKIETMPTLPLSPYAVSKLAQERLAVSFCNTYDINTTALRYFNVYGSRQRGGSYAGVMYLFIKNALKNTPLLIEGDGEQTRDFTYIDDVVNVNLLAASNIKSKGKVYNVGAGSRISINDLAKEIVRQIRSKSEFKHVDPRPGDVRDSLASIELARNDLEYNPTHTVADGLKKTIEWMRTLT